MQLSSQVLHQTAREFGTPVYVYHAEKITQQYQQLKQAFSNTNVRIFYACKALTNINILKHIKNIGCDVDCSSINEVKLALYAGFDAQRILYTSNGIAFTEIEEAQRLGVHINIDSLSNLQKFGERFGHAYPVGIRIRPDIMAGGNLKISTGHNKSKFGIPFNQLQEIIALKNKYNLHIRTLHIHTGSEIKDVEVFAKGIEVLFDITKHFDELEVIDLGGGFKVPYMQTDTGTNMQQLGEKVAEEFAAFEKQTGKKVQVWFEPGKYMVSEAGYFITTVNVLKQSGDINFAGVDSGLNHLIRPMFYNAYHVIENISNPAGAIKKYTITGNICETDTFAEDRELNEIREGDLLVFKNAGAYGFEMASNYNSRYKPAEVLVVENIPHIIRKRDEWNDLLKNQVQFL
jgi:diaminopimelate decarboxylase